MYNNVILHGEICSIKGVHLSLSSTHVVAIHGEKSWRRASFTKFVSQQAACSEVHFVCSTCY